MLECRELGALWPAVFDELGCCADCHRDFAAGRARPQPRRLPDGREALVCCGGAFFVGRLWEHAASHEKRA